ncbi:Protein MAIN-LIKE 2 [Glycine soja]
MKILDQLIIMFFMIKIIIYFQQFGMDMSVVYLDAMNTLQCLISGSSHLNRFTGFGYLQLLPAMSLDNALIAALVERWRETNSFDLAVGELTITLEDVSLLLGLAIDGEPVIGPISAPSSVCEKLLGRVPEDLNGGMVKLTWLKEFFSECPEDASQEEIERCTCAFLLYLVGSTIFSTTTGNKVPVIYLSLFEDFDKAGKFAWGPGALAFLYRALGNASLKSQSTISGCLTLVQCWCYSRLNVGLPKFNQEPDNNCFPFDYAIVFRQSGKPSSRSLLKAIWHASNYPKIRGTMGEEELYSGSRGRLDGKNGVWLSEWSEPWVMLLKVVTLLMRWYQKITRKYIRRVTSSLESEYQRTVTAMREIANIADIVSAEGLDSYNRELLDEVINIVHKCLTGQFEEIPNEKVKKKGKRKGRQKDHLSMEYE